MDPLHELIQTMGPSEKGQFKKYSLRQGGGDYLRLFDAIAAMETYDEEKILKKFRKDDFVKNLSRTKNYLYNAIMRALLEMEEQSAPKDQIIKYLREAEVLRNRGLVIHASKLVAKARIIAEERELFTDLINCLQMESDLSGLGPGKQTEYRPLDINNEISAILQKQANLNRYYILSSSLHEITTSSFTLREDEMFEKINEIKADPLLQDESAALCTKSLLRFNYIHYFISLILTDYSGQQKYALRFLDISLFVPAFNDEFSEYVLAGYNMVLAGLQTTGNSTLIEEYLVAFKNRKTGNKWIEALKFQYYSVFAVKHYSDTLNQKEFLDAAAYSLQQLKLLKGIVMDNYRLTLYVSMAEGYIRFGKYDEALDVIELYRRNPKLHFRFDCQNYLLFFYLISHYEMGNTQLVNNLIKNVKRFMQRAGEFSAIENAMLKVFDILINTTDRKKRMADLFSAKENIEQLAESNPSVGWNNNLAVIGPFIESKLSGMKYHKYINAQMVH